MNRDEKMQRMLLWFEECLPSHELGHVRVRLSEHTELVEQPYSMGTGASIEASVSCLHCHQSFRWMTGTSATWVRENPDDAIGQYLTVLERDAARTKCWGDVPKVRESTGFVALDAALAAT